MKKNFCILLIFVLSISLFSCSKKEEKLEEFDKMVSAMKDNDSFQFSSQSIYILDGEGYKTSDIVYKFNNYYSKEKEGNNTFLRENYGQEDTYLHMFLFKDKVFLQSDKGELNKIEGSGSFKLELEFLKMKKMFIDKLNIKEKDDEIKMSIELDLKSLKNRSLYFNGSEDIEFPEEVNRGHLDITLNKDYTIRKCESAYFIYTDEGLLERTAVIEFLEYGNQDIQFPEGIENL